MIDIYLYCIETTVKKQVIHNTPLKIKNGF